MGGEDHGLPPDNFQETPEPRVAHRTSPTNIGMGLLATLAAHDLGFIDRDALARKIDATLTTMEGLERHEGHLLNWYDTQSLAALPPRYVSTVDSGNLAGALMTLAEGLRESGLPRSRPPRLGLRGRHGLPLPLRPAAPDPLDRLSPGGRRGAGPPGQRRTTTSWPRRRGSRASSRIARGELPETHWFHLGRLVTSVHGTPTLLSWSGTAFEYLMPLLVMKSYPETLLDQTCRMAVRRQAEYAASRDVPWGISECAYNLTDRHGQLPVQGVRRPRPRPEAGPRRRAGRCALRDGPRRDGGARARRAKPAAPLGRRVARDPTGTTRGSTTRTRRPASSGPERRPTRPAGPSSEPTWPTTRA